MLKPKSQILYTTHGHVEKIGEKLFFFIADFQLFSLDVFRDVIDLKKVNKKTGEFTIYTEKPKNKKSIPIQLDYRCDWFWNVVESTFFRKCEQPLQLIFNVLAFHKFIYKNNRNNKLFVVLKLSNRL